MIDIDNNTVSLDLFKNVLHLIKDKPESSRDVIDSFSDNQFRAKVKLLNYIDNFLQENFKIVILGCWYGSILIPSLAPKVKTIVALDLDDTVVRIGKNRLFKEYENVSWCVGDAFTKTLNYVDSDLIINTSCEHMSSMKEWPYWKNIKKDCYFAFTSNNMDTIEGHMNCVYSIDEFKEQLPKNSIFLAEDEIIDERGTRYLLIGRISSL